MLNICWPIGPRTSFSKSRKIVYNLQVGESALKLHKGLASSSAEDFLHLLEDQMMAVCDVMIKKVENII